jgi:hypothetical protein
MAGRRQVAQHAASHHAESDKSDVHGWCFQLVLNNSYYMTRHPEEAARSAALEGPRRRCGAVLRGSAFGRAPQHDVSV